MERLSQIIIGLTLLLYCNQSAIASPFPINSNLEYSILTTEFLEFEVSRMDENKVELVWKTSSEENSEGFHIERLLEGETEWVNVGWLKGFGTVENKHMYRWADDNRSFQSCYYRIKQVDKDSSFTYSKVVQLKGEESNDVVRVFPIPTRDYVNIDLGKQTTGSVDIKIITNDGRLMYQGIKSIPLNSIITLQETADFPAGVYVMQLLLEDGEKVIQKFFKAQT